jgi:pyruvate dehydrogenase E2 component (dihydrolipoamide acetyltransferase)
VIIEVKMPKFGMGTSAAQIGEWLVTVGSRVEAGEELVEVETDKVTATVSAPASGLLDKIIASPGEEYMPGAVLCLIEDSPT